MKTSIARQCCSAVLLCSVLLAACAPETALQKVAQSVEAPAVFPASYYQQREAQGAKILRIDAKRSLLVLEVRRAGVFARLGHDHVVASHDLEGYVAPDEGRADISVRLAQLVIDEADLRAQAGFLTQPTADDIAGTRRNMLTRVLDSDRYPTALIHIARKNAEPLLSVAITLHGVTRSFEIPAVVEDIAGGMRVSGKMSFNQSDFGIVPFSILNGAIQVQDRLDLRFRIVADRVVKQF